MNDCQKLHCGTFFLLKIITKDSFLLTPAGRKVICWNYSFSSKGKLDFCNLSLFIWYNFIFLNCLKLERVKKYSLQMTAVAAESCSHGDINSTPFLHVTWYQRNSLNKLILQQTTAMLLLPFWWKHDPVNSASKR